MKRNENLPRGVFRRKGEYWIRYYDEKGKIHREKAGHLLTLAKDAVEKRRSEVRSAIFFPERMIRPRHVRFAELAAQYLTLAKRRKRSWRDAEDHINRLLPELKDDSEADLTPARLEAVLGEIAEQREWTPATFNRHRATLSGVFQMALASGKVRSNPARLVAHRKENNQRVRFLSSDEETKLMAAIRERWPEREAEIIEALHSGMRRSEQYRTCQVPDGGLKWEHLNFRASVLRLPRSKADKPREIPMNAMLRDALRDLPQMLHSPYVFQGTDPGRWFAKALRAAGITDFHWHDLRHTFGSRLAMAGVSMRHIAELMGHSEIQTTMRYAHLQPGHLAEAVDRLVSHGVQPEGVAHSTPGLTPAISGLSNKAVSG